MTDNKLERTAIHESDHAVSAWRLMLPLPKIFIREDGSGGTLDSRRFDWGEVEHWAITVFCGPAAEVQEFGNAPEGSDVLVIERMCEEMGMSIWNDTVLDQYRYVARITRETRAEDYPNCRRGIVACT
jgi:hypothetical protein